MTPARLRAADGGDLDALLELAVAFYAEDGFATTRVQLAQHLAVLVADDASRVAVVGSVGLVGFAVTTTSYGLENGLIAELEDLYVAPSARRQGLASQLIEDSAAWAASLGCRHLELVVAPNGSDVSQLFDFYAARGFRDEGRRLLARSLSDR